MQFLKSIANIIRLIYIMMYIIIFITLNVKLFIVDLEVTGLTPDKEYLFRVSAVNAEGESKPLEAEQAIVAKNPFGIFFNQILFFKI